MMGAWAAGGTGELGAMGALGGLGERTPGPVSRGIEEQWVRPRLGTPPLPWLGWTLASMRNGSGRHGRSMWGGEQHPPKGDRKS